MYLCQFKEHGMKITLSCLPSISHTSTSYSPLGPSRSLNVVLFEGVRSFLGCPIGLSQDTINTCF